MQDWGCLQTFSTQCNELLKSFKLGGAGEVFVHFAKPAAVSPHL